MRIAMIASFWPYIFPSGSAIYAFELSKRLASLGYEVHFFASSGGLREFNFVSSNVHVHLLKTYGVLLKFNPVVYIVPKILEKKFDIVHTHSYLYFTTLETAILKNIKKYKFVLQFHGGLQYFAAGRRDMKVLIKEFFFDTIIGRYIVSRADKILSIAKSDIPLIKRKFGANAEWLPNAVDPERFSIRYNADDNTVAYIGKLEEWKGIRDLIEIFKSIYDLVKNVKFLIVGSGSLEKLVRKSRLPIKMYRHIPYNKIHDIYKEISILVLPSYMEGAPNVVLEALACGIPVVASKVGDIPEIIANGKNGFLVDPGDVKTFSRIICELLKDRELRLSISREAKNSIREKFSFDVIARKVDRIYRNL